MTLILSIVAPWGIWQCTDYRLAMMQGGQVVGVTDRSPKHVTLLCPDGACSMAYTGQASARWIYRPVPITPGGAGLDEQARTNAANAIANATAFGAPLGRFENTGFEVTEPCLFAVGDLGAVSRADIQRVKKIIARRPAYPEDHFALLAGVSRTAAKRSKLQLISPECVIKYMPAEGVHNISHQETWGNPAAPVDRLGHFGMLMRGMDLDQMTGGWVLSSHRERLDAEAAERTRLWALHPKLEERRAAARQRRSIRQRRAHERKMRRQRARLADRSPGEPGSAAVRS